MLRNVGRNDRNCDQADHHLRQFLPDENEIRPDAAKRPYPCRAVLERNSKPAYKSRAGLERMSGAK